MKKLLIAAAMAAGMAAPAFAQTAASGAAANPPAVEAQNVAPGAPAAIGAPMQSQLGVPGEANSQLAAQQAYDATVANPRDWTLSNPNNFDTPGG